jgi:hypothetical protein
MSEPRMAWKGRAGQVRVGHFIQGSRKTLDDVWEITEMRTPSQIGYANTLWWRAVNVSTGEQVAVPPRVVSAEIRFMLTPEEHAEAEETKRPPTLPRQWPSDSEEVLLLVEKLGAREIATRDETTGEIHCPDYDGSFDSARPGGNLFGVEEIEHLRIAHGLDVSGLEKLTGDERTIAITKAHGPLHAPNVGRYAQRGFPHRHTPEDHSIV